jgi:outer membrane protein assembly factor BamB
VSHLTEAEPGRQTAIALGNMLDNELLTRLYWSRYTFEDGRFPGPAGFTVHTVFDPHHWGGGQDVIVLGASGAEALGNAVERFLGRLQGEGQSTVLPYTLIVEPEKGLPAAQRGNLLAKPVDPSFTALRTNAEQYLKTGDEAYARVAIAALDIMVDTYRQKPDRPTPWPEETTAGEIFAAWDAFEECPLISPARRRDYLETMLAWSRDLTLRSYEYRRIDAQFTVTWNHTTFALLGLYYAGRYFERHYDLAEAREWLRKARLGFAAQARSWKPQEDADSYLVHTIGHTVAFSLADWDLRFFERGLIRQYADYVVACGDNRQWPAGFGDSGYGVNPTLARAALPIAYWWTRDSGYRWLLDRAQAGGWENPFWPAVAPRAPERFVGLNVFPLDRQIYDDTQRRPSYNEAFARAEVAVAEAWDKISFRENWEPHGQYLLLDGLGRGKHLHYDTNSIVTFVQDGERWLIDHDYLVRNTTEHSMLSVLRDGRSEKLVPSLAGLAGSGDLPGMAATHTYVKDENGVDWDRRILWSKGRWFLVQDTVTARAAGNYDLDLTWKTIDRGDQRVNGGGQFVARRTEPATKAAPSGKAPAAPERIGPANPPIRALHIDPAEPVRAWVTDHVRQGISVPVSILHQRQSVALTAGASTVFCSLLYATGPEHPAEFAVEAVHSGAYRVISDGAAAMAGFGPDRAGRWQCDAAAWLINGQTISLVAARSVDCGAAGLVFEPAANVGLDASAGTMVLTAAKPTRVTARGGATVGGQLRREFPAGTHLLSVAGLDGSSLGDATRRGAKPTLIPQSAASTRELAKPLWSVALAERSPVFRITPADINGDGQPELLVACGQAGHAVSASGQLLWSQGTAGVVRDVSLARFAKGGPPTILVSSADTFLYQLDSSGRQKRKDQLTGIYFSADHGERPWGLYCTRGVDQDGDGVDDMIVTTLASMESRGFTPDMKRLWRTLAAYHGCIEMAVEDVDRDGKPEIVIANKYGAVFVLHPDGRKLMNSSTSIGDVTFALGDLTGDGRSEIVHGSSTGDLIAVNLQNKTLWSFNNYGYPVERIRCADLNGDGRPEVLVASGTGYLYCLDAAGALLWQRRLGLAVHDVALAGGLIIAGTEDGEVHALDAKGNPVWSRSVGAAVTKLAPLPVTGGSAVVVGLADGRLLALPVR